MVNITLAANCIAPSTIRSPLIEPYLQDENARRVLNHLFHYAIGDPEDISGAVCYLSLMMPNGLQERF